MHETPCRVHRGDGSTYHPMLWRCSAVVLGLDPMTMPRAMPDPRSAQLAPRILCKMDHGCGGGPLWVRRSVVPRASRYGQSLLLCVTDLRVTVRGTVPSLEPEDGRGVYGKARDARVGGGATDRAPA
jgi:hypothetical protein